MLAGIVMAGGALVGLSYVDEPRCVLSVLRHSTRSGTSAAARCRIRCCCRAGSTAARGKAMGVAYLGIGLGGAIVPLLAYALTQTPRMARRVAGARPPDDR